MPVLAHSYLHFNLVTEASVDTAAVAVSYTPAGITAAAAAGEAAGQALTPGVASQPQPTGPAGSWTLAWSDEFDGDSVDTDKWWVWDDGGVRNGVPCYASNVYMSGGYLNIRVLNASSGAAMVNADVRGNPMPANGYRLPVGGCCEARVSFPGSGTSIYNWPAWWTVGGPWQEAPGVGEYDIAEGLGTMQVHYHGNAGAPGAGIPGTWAGAFHVYTLVRDAADCYFYYDGSLVWQHATADDGSSQGLVFNNGVGYGAASYPASLLVDYVRAWEPA